MARALLEIFEESKAMAVFNRDCLTNTLKLATFASAAPADPSIDDASLMIRRFSPTPNSTIAGGVA